MKKEGEERIMKFLCDQMLGTLARWLRLLGFDTFYATVEMKDDELLQIAKKENRILITRDKELILRAKNQNIRVTMIDSTDLEKQLIKVLQKNKAIIHESKVLSRCSCCNTPLTEISKQNVKNRVPPKIFEKHNTFWHCSTCNKIYWMGSHYDKIMEKIQTIRGNNS